MNFRYILLTFIALNLFCACGDRFTPDHSVDGLQDLSKMDYVVIKDDPEISIDSIIEKIEYVKLGNTGDVLIGKVTHLLFTPDHIVVGDAKMANSVFIFDRTGNIQTVISRLGRSPNEYQGITDMDISPDLQKITILDAWGKQLISYDMDGNFLEKRPLELFTDGVKWIDDGTLLIKLTGGRDPNLVSYPDPNDLLLFMDTTLQFKYSAFPNRFNSDNFQYDPLVVKRFDDRVLISVPYSDTIYQYTPQGIQPRYKFDMEAVNGIANFGKDMTREKYEEVTSNHTSFCHKYVECDDFAMFSLSKKKVWSPVLYEKKRNGHIISNNNLILHWA